MSCSSFLRIYLILIVVLVASLAIGTLADDIINPANLTFDEPVRTNMPVWAHIKFPEGGYSWLGANLRYPYSWEPWFFSVNDFEVTIDGKPLPRLKHAGDVPNSWGGAENGSAAPASSPTGRLPLHLWYRFGKPGTYMVRFKCYDHWGTKNKKLVAESEWTPLEVKPFSSQQRSAWVKDQIANQPTDAGLIVGDYLPSLLAVPDEKVLPAILKCIHHPNSLVQNYALKALDYFGDDVIRREIPKSIAKEGPTQALAYYLSWKRDLFQPAGSQLVDSMIPFLKSDSAETVGGTLHAFLFMQPPAFTWKNQAYSMRKMDAAVWASMPHMIKFKEREVIQPIVEFMGMHQTKRSHLLLWKYVGDPTVGEQAVICLAWKKNNPSNSDLSVQQRLAQELVQFFDLGYKAPGSPPYAPGSQFDSALIPYLLEGVKYCPSPTIVERCIRGLIDKNSAQGLQLFKDALDDNRPYKQSVINGLRKILPNSQQASKSKLLKIVNEKIAASSP